MDINEDIILELQKGWNLRDKIKSRLNAPNLAVAVQRRFQELYQNHCTTHCMVYLIFRDFSD